MAVDTAAPTSFYTQGPNNPTQVTSPAPTSFYRETAAFNLVYYGALSSPPTVDPFGNALLVGALYYDTVKQALYVWNGTLWAPYAPSVTTLDFVLTSTAVLTTGSVIYRVVPFNATVVNWTLLADVSGTCTVDVQQCSFSAYNPPTTPGAGNSITNGNPMTIVSGLKNTSVPLWQQITAGNILALNLTAVTNIHTLYMQLQLQRL